MPTSRPTTQLNWADDGARVVPSLGKRMAGWVGREHPPAQFLNWWQWLAGQWQLYTTEQVDSLGSRTGSLEANDATYNARVQALEAGTAKLGVANTFSAANTFNQPVVVGANLSVSGAHDLAVGRDLAVARNALVTGTLASTGELLAQNGARVAAGGLNVQAGGIAVGGDITGVTNVVADAVFADAAADGGGYGWTANPQRKPLISLSGASLDNASYLADTDTIASGGGIARIPIWVPNGSQLQNISLIYLQTDIGFGITPILANVAYKTATDWAASNPAAPVTNHIGAADRALTATATGARRTATLSASHTMNNTNNEYFLLLKFPANCTSQLLAARTEFIDQGLRNY